MWQILYINKCTCVVCLFYTYGLMPHMFYAFAHAAHMRTYVCVIQSTLRCKYVQHQCTVLINTRSLYINATKEHESNGSNYCRILTCAQFLISIDTINT